MPSSSELPPSRWLNSSALLLFAVQQRISVQEVFSREGVSQTDPLMAHFPTLPDGLTIFDVQPASTNLSNILSVRQTVFLLGASPDSMIKIELTPNFIRCATESTHLSNVLSVGQTVFWLRASPDSMIKIELPPTLLISNRLYSSRGCLQSKSSCPFAAYFLQFLWLRSPDPL